MLSCKVSLYAEINLFWSKIKGAFPLQKAPFCEKNSYIYIRKGGNCPENKPPFY
jgi:hypothetical protein